MPRAAVGVSYHPIIDLHPKQSHFHVTMMLAHVWVQYKRTGRWEAHIWDSSEPGAKKGRQLHLGSFPAAEPAAM